MTLPRAVLWDLDGTLADSRDFHWRSWRDTMTPAGVAVTEAQFLESFGRRNDAIIPTWLGARSTPELVRELGEAKEALYRVIVDREGLEPLPGAGEWVRRLADEGWLQAFASSAPKQNVELMARVLGLAPYMNALVSADDVTKGKPDPEVFLKAAAALGVPPDRCVVVEDAAAGIEAARRATMRCIGVGDGETAGASIRIASLDRLPADAFEGLVRR